MKKYIIFVIAFSLLLVSHISLAAPVGRITSLEGRVDVLKTGKNIASPINLGDPVDVGDIFRAKSNSRTEITFINKNLLRITPNTRVEIKEYMVEGDRSSSVAKLHRGRVQAVAAEEFIKKAAAFAEGNKFEVHTPNAVAGIRGTNMVVSHERGFTGVLFIEGKGYLFNPQAREKMVPLTAGFISFVTGPTALPTTPRRATEGEMEIYQRATSMGGGGALQTALLESEALSVPMPTWIQAPIVITLESPPAPPAITQINPSLVKTTPTTTYFESNIDTSLQYFTSATYSSTLFGTVPAPISFRLTWGATPSDLDAHAWIPPYGTYTTPYHVYFGNYGALASYPYTSLDQDITGGYGPETITINQFTNGTTYYSVYNWSGSPAITASNAIVVVKDGLGNTITTYNVPLTGTGDWLNILSIVAASSSSGVLYTINTINTNNPLDSSWQFDGSIVGILKGTGSLWTSGANPVPATMSGNYTPSTNQAHIWSTTLYSWNSTNSTYTTYDGGAYNGVISGSELNNNMDNKAVTFYIDPSGNAGFLKGSLTGSANSGTFSMSGSIYTTEILSGIGIAPKDLHSNIVSYYYPSATGSGSFSAGGTITSGTLRNGFNQKNITNQNWGIWHGETGGTYSGNTSDSWTDSVSFDYSDRINQLEMAGTKWSDNKTEATTYGYGADGATGTTWINVGDLFGSFNPTASTWQHALLGVWMDTNRFLDMASTESGKTRLQQLNIPCIEVGNANLTGTGNNLTVNMNAVKFFSPTAGGAPKIWATGNVSGSYTASPSIGAPVAISGSGLSANFNVQQWNIGTNRWLSTVTNGTGTLSGGSYSGPVTFKGAAAGTINTVAATFSGTAAGTAK